MEILNLPEYELIEHRTLADTKTELLQKEWKYPRKE